MVNKAWHHDANFRKSDATTNFKYLIWSIYPKDINWVQTTDNANAGSNLDLEFGSYKLATYEFDKVAEPTAAIEPVLSASAMWISTSSVLAAVALS